MTDLVTFNYQSIDRDIRPRIIDATTRLHVLERKTGEQVLEIGRILIEVKAALGHGQFVAWLDSEFGWSRDTARNFMSVAEMFGDMTKISSFAPSALYALASNSVPAEIREEFVAQAEAGGKVTHKQVMTVLREARKSEPPKPLTMNAGKNESSPQSLSPLPYTAIDPATRLEIPSPAIQQVVDAMTEEDAQEFAEGFTEMMRTPVLRVEIQNILVHITTARFEFSKIDTDTLCQVLAEDDVSRQKANDCLEKMATLSQLIRNALGLTGGQLWRVS